MSEVFDVITSNERTLSILVTCFAFVVSLLTVGVTYASKQKIDIYSMKNEDAEIEKAIKNITFSFKDIGIKKENKDRNVLNMMIDNVSELREYYVISKQQARKSFSAALLACIFGFVIYIIGIIAAMFFKVDTALISIIGGTTAELISVLFFGLYRESTKQLGVYHQRLGSTEKYLTTIQIIKEMPEDKQYEMYSSLIEHILQDNQEIIKHDFGGKTT